MRVRGRINRVPTRFSVSLSDDDDRSKVRAASRLDHIRTGPSHRGSKCSPKPISRAFCEITDAIESVSSNSPERSTQVHARYAVCTDFSYSGFCQIASPISSRANCVLLVDLVHRRLRAKSYVVDLRISQLARFVRIIREMPTIN